MHAIIKERMRKMTKYNTEKLESVIRAKYGTQKAFAKAAGLYPSTVSRLLQRGDWKASQMKAALIALEIPLSDVEIYFFDESRAVAQQQRGKK